MVDIKDKRKCCGCTACYNICPRDCIEMIYDEEGFSYPHVNDALCIGCGLCEKKCPILNKPKSDNHIFAYVGVNNCQTIRAASTSGGVIGAINNYVLEELNGVVYGVVYDDSFMPVHRRITNIEEAYLLCGSKYAQSELSFTFKNIKKDLEDGATVAFTGTPCQVAGLKSYLGKEYDGLIAIDLVCRSIPSPKLWKKYLEWQADRHNSSITKVNCRAKTYGYHNGTLTIDFRNGRKYSGSNRVDLFMKAFHKDVCSRPSCYDCHFKDTDRCSDFTIFDSWNANYVTENRYQDDNLGCSNIICRNDKAKQIIDSIKGIDLYEASVDRMYEYSGEMERNSILYTDARKNFYRDLDEIGLEKTIKSRVSITFKDYLIEMVKPLYFRIKRK